MNSGKLEWFAGNEDALRLYEMFIDVAQTWDDMVDKDRNVPAEAIHRAFTACLAVIPANPFYQRMFHQLQPLLLTAVMGYRVSVSYENTHDEHGLELGHTLRYAVAQVFIYIIIVLNGLQKAQEMLPEILKEMMPERIAGYLEEHKDAA